MASRFSAWIHNLWKISTVGVFVVCAGEGLAQQVIQVTWPTRYAAEPPALSEQERQWMPTFQFALKSLPEETSMSLALGQPQLLGLDAAEAVRLRTLFSATAKFTSKMKVTFISGSREPHIASGSLERQLNQLRLRAGAVKSEVIPGADHYFLISHEGQTRKALRSAVQR